MLYNYFEQHLYYAFAVLFFPDMNIKSECLTFDCGGGDCIKTEGSFRCDCFPGFIKNAEGSCIGMFLLVLCLMKPTLSKCIKFLYNYKYYRYN